ncbi:hypothetical protein D3C75_712060 [compost metagenome]
MFFWLLLIHVDQRTARFNVLQFFLVYAWMVVRLMNHFEPHEANNDTQPAHKEEHMRPAHFVRQPTHDWREDNGGEILCGVKNRDRRAAFLCREPRCDDSAVAGEGRCFGQTHQEAQSKQRDDDAKTIKDIDETLQQGKHRPDKDGPEIDAF